VLEDTGLIVPVGEWAIAEACRQSPRGRRGLVPRPVAVNLSARQFQEDGLLATVRHIVAESGVDAAAIQFEITESLLMKDRTGRRHAAPVQGGGIQALGGRFRHRLFELAYLKSFPLDALKIDRAFVARSTPIRRRRDRPGDHRNGAQHEAQGDRRSVETHPSSISCAGGCDEMQGFYFSKPLPRGQHQALAENRRLQS